MDLGTKILKLRKGKNLSQEKLAEQLGITRQTLANWESNITTPEINQIKKLTEIFKISINDLVDNNLIMEKVNNTEKLAKKQFKFIKIVLITLYLIIFIGLICFIVYMFNKKDFTDYYSTEFTYYANDNEYKIYLTTNEDGESIIETYISNLKTSEEYPAGESIHEQIASLNTIKKVIIKNGGTCKE